MKHPQESDHGGKSTEKYTKKREEVEALIRKKKKKSGQNLSSAEKTKISRDIEEQRVTTGEKAVVKYSTTA